MSKTKQERVSGPERLKLVREGLEHGKSQRQIARELGFDPSVIRRDVKILQLPSTMLEAVEGGADAEQYLRAVHLQRAAEAIQQRLDEERADGCHSTALAGEIQIWLRAKDLAQSYEKQLLDIVERANWEIPSQLDTPRQRPDKVLARASGGDPEYMTERLVHLANVLLKAMPMIAPEREIRDAALQKVRAEVLKPRRPVPGSFGRIEYPASFGRIKYFDIPKRSY